MKHFIIITLCLSSTFLLSAQSEMTTWLYNLEDEQPKIKNQRNPRLLKIVNNKRYNSIDDFLGKTIRLAIENEEMTIYKNKACNNPFTNKEAINVLDTRSVDTVMILDAENHEENIKYIANINTLFPNASTTYELVQEWNYNDKSNQLEMSLKSVNIYYSTKNRNNKVSENHLFSFKTNDLPNVTQIDILNNPNVIWAKEIRYNGTFESQNLMDKLLSKTHFKNNLVFDFIMDKKIDNVEIKEIQTSIDTVITFDPSTFQEEIKIVKSELKKADIKSFQVIQDIYFDTEKNQLRTKLYAIAPLRGHYDAAGNLKFSQPIFWVIYDESILENFD